MPIDPDSTNRAITIYRNATINIPHTDSDDNITADNSSIDDIPQNNNYNIIIDIDDTDDTDDTDVTYDTLIDIANDICTDEIAT